MSDSFVISYPVASVQRLPKAKMIDLICKAIEVTGVPKKGSSYKAIRNWIVHNWGTEISSNRLTALLKRAFDAGLEKGVLCRPSKYKDNTGLTGWFLLVKNVASQKGKELASKIVRKSIPNTRKPTPKLTVGKSGVAGSAPSRAKSKAVATKSVPTGAKSKAAATKSVPTGAKSKAAATKSVPSGAKSKAAATKSVPSGAKSKIVATKSVPTTAKTKIVATKSVRTAVKLKVATTKSAPNDAKSEVAAARSAPRKIETENVATVSSITEHSTEVGMVMSSPTATESEIKTKISPITQNTEIAPETSEALDMPKQVHKAAKGKPGSKTAKSKFSKNTKVKKLFTSDEEPPSADLPRKDLSDTELEVKRFERKSLKSYSSDTDLTFVKEMDSNPVKQKRKTQKHTKGKF